MVLSSTGPEICRVGAHVAVSIFGYVVGLLTLAIVFLLLQKYHYCSLVYSHCPSEWEHSMTALSQYRKLMF
jgi:hypothetical protein